MSETLDFSEEQVLVCGGSDGIGLGVATAFQAASAEVSVTGTRDASQCSGDFSGLPRFHALRGGSGARPRQAAPPSPPASYPPR